MAAIIIAQGQPTQNCQNYMLNPDGTKSCLQSRPKKKATPKKQFIAELQNGDRLYLLPKTISEGNLPRNKYFRFWVENIYDIKGIDGTYKVTTKYQAFCMNQSMEILKFWTYRTRGAELTEIPPYLRVRKRAFEGTGEYVIWQSVCG